MVKRKSFRKNSIPKTFRDHAVYVFKSAGRRASSILATRITASIKDFFRPGFKGPIQESPPKLKYSLQKLKGVEEVRQKSIDKRSVRKAKETKGEKHLPSKKTKKAKEGIVAKFISKKDISPSREENEELIENLRRGETVNTSWIKETLKSRQKKPKKGVGYRTFISIEFEYLNYYPPLDDDKPELQTKWFRFGFPHLMSDGEIANAIPDIEKLIQTTVDYKHKDGKFLLDNEGIPVKTELQYVRITKIAKWKKPIKKNREDNFEVEK